MFRDPCKTFAKLATAMELQQPAKGQLASTDLDVLQSGCDQGDGVAVLSTVSASAAEAVVQDLLTAAAVGSATSSLNEQTSKQPEQAQVQQEPSAVKSPASSTPPRRACLDWVEAAKSGDTLELRRLLRLHPSLLNHQVGGLQCTAAHWAAANGHADALQHLLEWGTNINMQTATGCTPLHSAAAAGRADCVQQLLLAYPSAQQQQLTAVNEDGCTAAQLALHHGHKMVHGLLVQAAAQASQPEGQKVAASAVPLQQQHQTKQAGMRRGFLLSSQAPQQQQQQRPASIGAATSQAELPPAVAPQHLHEDQATAAGYEVSTAGAQVSTEGVACSTAADTGAQHSQWDSTVDNPLYGVASPMKQPPPQRQQQQPAHTTCSRMSPAAHTGLDIPAPLQPAAAPTAPAAAGVSDVGTPGADLQQAPSKPAVGAAGADGNMQQQPAAVDRTMGRSWLDAARAGDLPLLQALLQQQPQLLNYRGAGISYAFVGNSALHWASAKGHRACVAWLLQQGAAVDSVNEAGASALHTAVEHGQPGCAEMLVLLGGADLQAQDGYGQSVLTVAGGSSSSSRGGGKVRAEQLLLWDEARKLQQQDR